MSVFALMRQLDACKASRTWVERFGEDFESAWLLTNNLGWLYWFVSRISKKDRTNDKLPQLNLIETQRKLAKCIVDLLSTHPVDNKFCLKTFEECKRFLANNLPHLDVSPFEAQYVGYSVDKVHGGVSADFIRKYVDFSDDILPKITHLRVKL